MKVQFYTQSQPKVANINLNKPNNTFHNQSGVRISSFPPSKAYSAQISQINFTAAPKTNYIKEIFEQPKVIGALVDKYFSKPGKVSNLDLGLTKSDLKKVRVIKIIASGSSKNVAEMTRNFIEEVVDIPVSVHFASEFAHQKPVYNKNDLMIFISQSGETADTFAALEKSNLSKLRSIALTNTPGSKIHKGTTVAVEVGAGKELAVAATKSVTAQMINLYAIGLKLAETKGTLSAKQIDLYASELKSIPENFARMLKDNRTVKIVAKELIDEKNFYLLGRGANYGSVMEGELKMRETTYSNPTSSASGEFLHGYIASVDETTPVIQVIQGKKGIENYDLAYGNLREVITKRSPKKTVIIKDETNKEIELTPFFKDSKFINIPSISENFSPVFVVGRFQMLANELTKLESKNPDLPRSLTKAVLSE